MFCRWSFEQKFRLLFSICILFGIILFKVLYYIVVATSTKTDIEVDIDEIATDLNGKADVDLSNVPTSKGILTESYVNGTSWYRVYSDGWCEQGGQASATSLITLLKPFINTNYKVMASILYTNYTNWSVGINKANTSSFYINMNTGSNGVDWIACGYIR
jgi:hypothetical protein